MPKCIRCGKPCGNGETMCEECKAWFQNKTGRSGSSIPKMAPAAPQKSAPADDISLPEEKTPAAENVQTEQIVRNERNVQTVKTEQAVQAEKKAPAAENTGRNARPDAERKKAAPAGGPNMDMKKLLPIAAVAVVVIIVLVVLLAGKGRKHSETAAKEETSRVVSSQQEEAAAWPKKEPESEKQSQEPFGEETKEVTEEAAAEKPEMKKSDTEDPRVYKMSEAPVRKSDYTKRKVKKAEASSELKQPGNPEISNAPFMMVDGDEITSWQEGVKGDGIGQFLYLYLSSPEEISFMTFKMGNWRDKARYDENYRPKTISLWLDNTYYQVTFPDGKTEFCFVLDEPVTASEICIQIDDVYRSTYDDTCISEIEIYG